MRLLDWVLALSPRYWFMSYPYSDAWDARLNQLMEQNTFKWASPCQAKLGGVHVWIENHPYASFSPYKPAQINVRPSRLTIIRAHRKLVTDLLGADAKYKEFDSDEDFLKKLGILR